MQQSERRELAMQSFIETCQACMTSEQWACYFPEAERSAGETFHIVRDLVFALAETQTPILPPLRKALEHVLQECGIDRNSWTDLRRLNFDPFWRTQYGYDRPTNGDMAYFCPHSPSDPSQ